jgi:hypothetical protein
VFSIVRQKTVAPESARTRMVIGKDGLVEKVEVDE